MAREHVSRMAEPIHLTTLKSTELKIVCNGCIYNHLDKPGLCMKWKGFKPREILQGQECPRYESKGVDSNE